MGLVATLKELKDTSAQELNRYSETRPVMVDGSLSEIVTRAMNLVYTKKNMTTGEPFYGNGNGDGTPANGAGGVPNLLKPDSPTAPDDRLVRPSLESQQQMNHIIESAAGVLAEAVSVRDPEATTTFGEKPIIVYAIPEDKKITEEMNDNIEMYSGSGSIDIADFIFVTTDAGDTTQTNGQKMIEAGARIDSMIGEGAKSYPDLQSFLDDLHNLRRKN